MYTWHVTTFLFLSLGLLSLKGRQKAHFCIHKMSKESSLSQLSRLKSEFLNLSPPYSQSQNSYQILFFSLIIFPYPSLICNPQHLSPPEFPTTIAGLPVCFPSPLYRKHRISPHGKVIGPWGLSGERTHSLEPGLTTFMHSLCFCCESGEIRVTADKDIGQKNTQICIHVKKVHAMRQS